MIQIDSPRQFIAGRWRAGRGDSELLVTDPATGERVAGGPAAGDADIDDALAAAEAGFAVWRERTVVQRAAVLRRAAGLLRERSETIAVALTREQGKPLAEARREIEQAADTIEWHADEGRRAYGRVIPSRWPGTRFTTELRPVGPAAAITPWNFPVMLPAIKVSAALAAGCSVILKPADETPLAVGGLLQALHDAGVPDGAVQMLVGSAPRISARLLEAPLIRKLSFTGSTAVGRLLAEQAGRQLKPITLELGGHAPVIVAEDADPERAAAVLAGIKFRNAGQICANPSRFYVHRSIAGRFAAAMVRAAESLRVGHGLEPGTTMGPLALPRRLAAVQSLVDDAVACGAHLLTGGARIGEVGCFFAPTVLADVPTEARVMREEPFGPLVPIRPFDTLDEALEQANGLSVGLAAFGFTTSLHTARRLSEELRAGSVALNCVTLMQPETPFGGVGDSGFGRENGSEGLAGYLETRTVATDA